MNKKYNPYGILVNSIRWDSTWYKKVIFLSDNITNNNEETEQQL